ncbi:MAG TPA: flagellar hook-associated protein FlgK [Terracidiphilus sp.]|nr:flagellar hook-associated protein FlgK [Terracidiphilus sp.]
MGTINSAFSIMSQALDADQSALNIVANNVANANTPGYAKQIPNWQENDPVVINGVFYGTGVTETGATSVRDRVLTERLNQQQQLVSASGSRLSALNTLQAMFSPNLGSTSSTAGDIGSDITSLFSSFSSLEANPTDNSLREQVLSSASTLAGDLSNAAASLNSQRSALNQQTTGVVSQVNALTGAIAQLNKQIRSTSPNADAGTLEDQRQHDLSQLSQLIGINQVATENNGLAITTTSGQLLVSGDSSVQLTSGTLDGVAHFFLGTTDVTAQLATGGGALCGDLVARDQDIPNVLASLDQLAYSVSTQVNALNNAGTDLAGNNGNAGNVFYEPTAVAGSAWSMSAVMTDPTHISAGGLGQGTGDNTNAMAMANLGSQGIVNGQSPSNFYANFVTTLGSTVSNVQTENTAQNASVTQLQAQNDALSSVNLNDEAVAMSTLERSYQAASQVFAMLNTIMASALNLGEQTTVN